MSEDKIQEIILTGIGGAPGISIGPAYLVDRPGQDVIDKYNLDRGQVSSEVLRFKSAVKKAESELGKLIKKSPKELGQQVYILEAHKALLRDKMFYGKTVENIKKARVNAEWALKTTVDRVKLVFSKIEDSYIRERVSDVVWVYQRVLRNLSGTKESGIEEIDKRVILVARDFSPAETSQMHSKWVKGFVTDVGAMTSHTSIIARTLQIPAVMGVEKATRKIQTGDIIILDGRAGVVILNPREETLVRYAEAKERYEDFQEAMARDSLLPARTKDGFSVHINANIELLSEAAKVKDLGGDGIGLYRTEFLYLNRRDLPTEKELFDNYRKLVRDMAPKPVTIRTLDVNGDKVASGIMADEGDNPALGLRAIRFCLNSPDIFRTQLRAILRASAFGRVRLLFPMISGVDEMLEVVEIMEDVKARLKRRGQAFDKELETGIMIEVPSAAIIADMLAEYVDFFSIGTNDLIQYSLAVDRGNKMVAHLFQNLHPAVMRLIKRVSDVGKEKGVRLAMCGEMAADPICLPLLLGMGFDELSMNPQAMPFMKNVVRGLSINECRRVVEHALREPTSRELAELLAGTFGESLMPDQEYSPDWGQHTRPEGFVRNRK